MYTVIEKSAVLSLRKIFNRKAFKGMKWSNVETFRDRVTIDGKSQVLSWLLRDNKEEFKSILYTKVNLNLKEGTKTVYESYESETSAITEETYQLITCDDTVSWFRRAGRSEHVERSYTKVGYLVTSIVSKSPCREVKTVRTFCFEGK